MDSAIAPDRHSASAERVDTSSVLVAKVSYPGPSLLFAGRNALAAGPDTGAAILICHADPRPSLAPSMLDRERLGTCFK